MRNSFRWMCLGWLVVCGFMRTELRAQEIPQGVLQVQQQRVEAIARAVPAAVCIFSGDGQGGGSGVVISPDGYALTNFHVVQPCGNFMKCGMADGQMYEAVLVGLDATGDVALIKLHGRTDFPVADMGDSDTVRAGDWCFAVGNPFVLATDLQPSVSYGIVSGVHRYQYPAGTLLEYADCIQTDAAINPGNSGGPLFNANGQLIGINGRASFEKRGRVNVGVGYAISMNQIKNFLGSLRSGRIVDHATLGATVSSNDSGRVIVSNILSSSDASRRGLRYGDEILSFGNRRITTANGFKNALGIYPKGWRVPLTFQHNGQRTDINVRLAGVHSDEELLEMVRLMQIGPPQPMPQPMPAETEAKPAGPQFAPELTAQFEAKRGYANYYFNKQNRERVWSAFSARGAFTEFPKDWLLRGKTGGNEVKVELGEQFVTGRFSDGPTRIDVSKDLTTQLQPVGSGGLLVGLHLWKRLLTQGPKDYGDVYYFGEAPLPGRDGLFDVLVGVHAVVETHFYFETTSGRLVAMEVFPELDSDPCEIFFDDYRAVDGREIPHLITVDYAGQRFTQIQVTDLDLMLTDEEKTKEANDAPTET